jgi:protein-S-isoprenylcysteine O-methyltransferase Ste14
MRLREDMEMEGAFLFRYRGQFPLAFFLLSIPVVLLTDYDSNSEGLRVVFHVTSCLLVIIGMAIRFYTVGTTPPGTSGRNTEGQVAESLNTTGIYSLVRHPLYLGNYLVWLGLVLFTESLYFCLLFSLVYWIYYERIMLAEEKFIAEKFGASFADWSSRTPAFLPGFTNFVPSKVPFSIKPGLRGEYSGFIAIAISYLYLEVLIGWVRFHTLVVGHRMLFASIVVVVLSLVLRTLKHHTRVLDRNFTA